MPVSLAGLASAENAGVAAAVLNHSAASTSLGANVGCRHGQGCAALISHKATGSEHDSSVHRARWSGPGLRSLLLSAEVVPLLTDTPVWQAAVVPAIRLWPERPTLSQAEDRGRIGQSPRSGRTGKRGHQQQSQAAAEPAQAQQAFRSHWAHRHSPHVSPSTLEWRRPSIAVPVRCAMRHKS